MIAAIIAVLAPLPSTETAAVAQSSTIETMASGTARIVRRSNGDTVLQFENFRVTGGPDLRMWVTDAANISNARAARRANHPDPGRLQSNRGDRSYVLPAEALGGDQRSIVIRCRAFGVLFASAPLS